MSGCRIGSGAGPKTDRRGRNLPLSHLFQVVQRVQRSPPGGRNQLSGHRLRRRHQAGDLRPGRLWRNRRPHDRRPTGQLKDQAPPHSHRPRRGRPHLQRHRRQRPQILSGRAGRHLSRQDHQLERPAHRQGQPRREASNRERHRGSPLRRQRHYVHLLRLPDQGQQGLGERPQQGHRAQLAQGPRRLAQ